MLTDDFIIKEENPMSTEETTQEDVLVKADPFYLKITERTDGLYLHDNNGRVIHIDLRLDYIDRCLRGEFNRELRGVTKKEDGIEQILVVSFSLDEDDQLVMKYHYTEKNIPELFISKVHVLGNISKDRSSVTTKDGNVLKPYMLGETLWNILLGCKDGVPHTHHLLYKDKTAIDFKVLHTDIVKNNSILTVNNYFGELITHIHVEDLLRENEESSIENGSEITEMSEAPETNDPTKNMMTAEEARGGSNTILFNTFSHLNDKVGKAVEEGKRFIDVKPNTTIPDTIKDTVLRSLREDLGYTVEVSFSKEIRISW